MSVLAEQSDHSWQEVWRADVAWTFSFVSSRERGSALPGVRACVPERAPPVLQRRSLTHSYQISQQNGWGNLGLARPDRRYSYNK